MNYATIKTSTPGETLQAVEKAIQSRFPSLNFKLTFADDGIGPYTPEGDFSSYEMWAVPKLTKSIEGYSKYKTWTLSQRDTLIKEFVAISHQEFPGI